MNEKNIHYSEMLDKMEAEEFRQLQRRLKMNYLDENTAKCMWCNAKTSMSGADECDGCWELRHRIEMDIELAKRMIAELQKGEQT